ncbi:MAG: hypothetical protein LQ339_002475 [Xanthoria mediterranea]|nr:MAG: hypothetical protein LQ339_002475 [Xanthoria mediterranea]
MHLSTILLHLTQVLSTLALPAASDGTPTLTVTTYPDPSCKRSPSINKEVRYNHIYNGHIRSYHLTKDLKPTDQLIFGDAGVDGEGMKNGCHDLGTEAGDFVLRGRASALSSPDLGVRKSDGVGDGLRRTPELGIILLAGFCGYYVLAVGLLDL